ncbi:hypothetical protein U0070_008180 [Myodes glareolus]|uniref:Vomeronasal type-1 receptor n=1 Tax=Myodes glareolus TaxID=447135 RepID=A0AAW0HPI4_MYOGA
MEQHKQKIQHIRSHHGSNRKSPESRATQNILVLSKEQSGFPALWEVQVPLRRSFITDRIASLHLAPNVDQKSAVYSAICWKKEDKLGLFQGPRIGWKERLVRGVQGTFGCLKYIHHQDAAVS